MITKKRIIIITSTIICLMLITLFILYKQGYIFNEKESDSFKYTPPAYEICDDNSCVYLLGSIHIGDSKVTKFTDSILDYYEKSDYLAVELDIQNVDIEASVKDYLLEFGETIEDKISEELQIKLKNFLDEKESMYTYEFISMFKLGFINSYISLLASMELNMTESGVDNYFLTLAHKENKEIIELETIEEQNNLIVNYDDEIYIKQIESSIDNFDEIKLSLKSLYNAYIEEDIEALKKLINEENEEEYSEKEKEYMNAMYGDRNIKMAENLENYLKEDKEVFIVVGAAHVLGEGGILDLIQNKNYKINLIN